MNNKNTKIFRFFKKIHLILLKAKNTPHNAAASISLGLFVGCVMPVGLQILAIIILSVIFKLNKLLTITATLITNPYTITFIYPLFIYTGAKILNIKTNINQDINYSMSITELFSKSTWTNLSTIKHNVLMPFFTGALFFGIVLSIIGYVLTYFIIYNYNNKKNNKKI